MPVETKRPFSHYDLGSDRTLSFFDIFVSVDHPQHAARATLSKAVRVASDELLIGWPEFLRFHEVMAVIGVLRRELHNEVHFGENKPGLFDSAGRPVPYVTGFDYGDLLGFGLSGADGRQGFLTECGLPVETTHEVLVLATTLLLIDQSVLAFESDRTAQGLHFSAKANECANEISALRLWPRLALAEKFKSRGRGRGSMRKLVESVMKKLPVDVKAREVWLACENSSAAKRLSVSFHGDHAWVDGHMVGYDRFRNIVSEVRLAAK